MLEWTGERYLPYVDPSISGVEIHYEHLHRYAFASQFVKGKKVLDLASGEGYGTFILSQYAQSVVGVEIDPLAVMHAIRTYNEENIRFLEGSILDIPIKGDKLFDVIVCFEAIEHVREHDVLLNEIRRLLKEEGLLIISTPDKIRYSDETGYQNPYHLKELYLSDFNELLQKKFSHVYLSGQQIVSGSSIFPVSPEQNSYSSEFIIEYTGKQFSFADTKERAPRYFIAIASNFNLNPEQLQRSYLIDKSNAEISFLTDKINKHEGSIQSLETIISANENQILLSQKTILSLENRVTEQDAKIQNSKTQVRDLEEQVSIQVKELSAARGKLDLSNQTIKAKDSEIDLLNFSLNKFKIENDSLKSSISYRLLAKFQERVVEPLFPPGTKRREMYDRGLRGGRIVVSQGFGKLLSEYKQYRAFKKNKNVSPRIQSTENVPEKVPENKTGIAPDSSYNQTVVHLHNQNIQKPSEYIPLSRDTISLTKDDIRCIAFYLPQFHPIPENDRWWGKGFTEWTNVTKALPQYTGHYQPHLPDELGFYDLRLPEIQKRQIELARHYGIFGFCFHYYWFNGKRLLYKPLDQFLEDTESDFPFCICWANENWTRRWDGMDHEVLISQVHSWENDIEFIKDIEHILRDSRYIRINGKPLLIVYRAGLLPDAKATTQRWRDYCKAAGIGDICLVAALAFGCEDPEIYGFDAAVEFPPHTMNTCNIITEKMKIFNPQFSGHIYDYEDFVKSKKYRTEYAYPCFRTVSPGWDNTARRQNNASVFHGANPDLYKEWLLDVARITKETHPPEEQIVFINAWNEWAEGTHLEPDRKFGYGYLQATADAIRQLRDPAGSNSQKIIIVSHDAFFHGAQMLALHIAKVLKEQFHYEVHLLLKTGGRLEDEFKKFSTVYNLERDYPETRSVNDLIKTLGQNGVKTAICNTVVTGNIVEILANNNIRTISLIHELPGIIHQLKQEENARKISTFADKIVFPAEMVRSKFSSVSELDDDKCVIAPQGLYLKNPYKLKKDEARALLRKKLTITPDSKIVLAVGYADLRKGVDLFVDTAKRVLQTEKGVYFVWTGHRDESFVRQLDIDIKQSGLEDYIRFVGIQEDINLFYAGSDLYLMTSREDPFPSTVLEAMNAGVPVIGFEDAGGFGELITPETGVLVPYLDLDAMAGETAKILNDPETLTQKGDNAIALINGKYNFIEYIYRLLDLLGSKYKKVSVIVPNYNYARYLKERLNCIVNQTYPIYEIIFLDDNSSDNSIEIAKRFAEENSVPITISKNDKNSGSVFRQWAKGIQEAHGDYIWIAEADDLCDTRFLETVMAGFENDRVILSYCQSKQMDECGEIIDTDYLKYTNDIDENKWGVNYTRDGIKEIRDSFSIKNTVPNVSATVFKKIDISEILDNLVRFKIAGDWFFYVWLLQKGDLAFFARSYNFHRRHTKGVTLSENKEKHFNEIVKMQDYVIQRFSIEPEIVDKVMAYRHWVKDYLLTPPDKKS
jgi:O-antigen biosynthesis protein